MNRLHASLLVAGLVLLTIGAFAGPWFFVATLLLAALVALRRWSFAGFAAATITVYAVLFWIAERDLMGGALAGARIAAGLGINLAVLAWIPPAKIVDGLRLPRAAGAWVGAVILAAHDVGRDFERILLARKLDGAWPKGILARTKAAAGLLPAMFVAAEERAGRRQDALRLMGRATPPGFVPTIAIAALAAAARMSFLVVPNVSLVFVVAFLGGMLYGPRIACGATILAMAVTDFFLSGLYPLSFVNAPAMAAIALMGFLLRRFDFVGGGKAERVAGLLFAFVTGVVGTLIFSVSADTFTWLLVGHGLGAAWIALVGAGLLFNAVPSILNGVLFAASVGPVLSAFRARREAPQDRPLKDPASALLHAST
ncbi:MAG: hypothetical protein ACYDDF_14360, partial [Thermoplasmatota archaeon]